MDKSTISNQPSMLVLLPIRSAEDIDASTAAINALDRDELDSERATKGEAREAAREPNR